MTSHHLSAVLRRAPWLVALVLLWAPVAAAEARSLRLGDRGSDARSLNARLASLGYLPAGPASARFDARTFHAVMAAQKWHGLQRDGIAGPRTQSALRRAQRPRAGAAADARRIDVIYSRQVALLISGGRVQRTVSVSTGADGYRTPPGNYRIFRKELRSWSHPYEVWLPYASYFNGGVAFHEWASVPPYPASHGCVRIPSPFAEEVYRFATRGTRVRVIYPPSQIGGDEAPVGPYGP